MTAPDIRRLMGRTCIVALILATTPGGSALAWWAPEGTLVSTAPASADGAGACSDDAAGAFVAWVDGRDAHFLDPDIYAQHLLSDGTLDAAWPASGRPVTTAAGSQYVAGVVPDGQGGSIILWLDTSRFGTGGYVRGDLYAMRLDHDGSLHDGWNAAGTPVDTAAVVYSGGYGLTVDGLGGLFVAWEDQRTGARDIRMQHVLGNGQIPTGWPVDGVPVCTAIGDQWSPVLAPDGVGGVYVCWADYRGIGGPVYIQHIEASGLPASGWPAGGRHAGPAQRHSGL
jgi:hypothetical protein